MENLIDIREHPCEICLERHKKRLDNNSLNLCDDCGKTMPEYPNMGTNGYSSATEDHTHLSYCEGLVAKEAVGRVLCLECYRIDYKNRYPNVVIPV